jgi:hypothetical protein
MVNLPSTVDWCEQNYILSEYVAEYWNTLTGLCLILSGIWYYKNYSSWINENHLHKYTFIRISALLVFVGIGTMLFHSTLYYPFQLLDELPMILLANEYLSLLLKLQTTYETINVNKYTKLLNYLKYSYKMIPVIILSYFIHPSLQVITFHLTLKVSEGCVLYILYKLSIGLNRIVYSKIYINQDFLKKKRKIEKLNPMISSTSIIDYQTTIGINTYSRFKKPKQLSDSALINIVQTRIKHYLTLRHRLNFATNVGICMYSCSIVLWCLENMFCQTLQPLQLHAVWHVLSSIGVYHLNLIMQLHATIEHFSYNN